MDQKQTVKVNTSFETLMRLAKELGDANKELDAETIEQCRNRLNSYADQCLKADRVLLGVRRGDL